MSSKGSPGDLAVSVRGVSKSYTIARNRTAHVTLTEAMLHRLRRPFAREPQDTFWALKDVNFDIQKGDVVGIIGRNGAGKSTLLKILSRITDPTAGQIDLYGRVGSLLEVGTGFHPELTGRENIYLNGHILGMRKNEIDREFDAIVDFSGVEKFLETPVKRYSSGMYVRLAFAVAAHLRSEILVLDEVLAVGDSEFQRKCLGKMRDVATGGRTVLFVSHNMQAVSVLCNRSIVLEHGTCVYRGDVPGGVARYLAALTEARTDFISMERRPGTGECRFTHVEAAREWFSCDEEKVIRYSILFQRPTVGAVFVSCLITDSLGAVVLHCDSRMVDYWVDPSEPCSGEFRFRSPWLKPGSYRVDFYLCNQGVLDRFDEACRLNVAPILPYPATTDGEAIAHGVVFADFSYTASKLLPPGMVTRTGAVACGRNTMPLQEVLE